MSGLFRSCVIDDVLEVDGRDIEVRPGGQRHLLPLPEGFQPEFEQPFGLFLLAGDQPDDVFVETFRDEVLLHHRLEPVLILARRYLFYDFLALFHCRCKDSIIFDALSCPALSSCPA